MKKITFLFCFLLLSGVLLAQKKQSKLISELDDNTEAYGEIAHKIWSFAEMGYQEEQNVALLQETLKEEE